MISYPDALLAIHNYPLHLAIEEKNVENAIGLSIAQDIFAPISLPPFTNSAVDGFAVHHAHLAQTRAMPIISSLRAQSQSPLILPSYMTAKIMTGAPIPEGADAVVMKEDVDVVGLGDTQAQFNKLVAQYENLRFVGEDVCQGDRVAATGDIITSSRIGLLHGLGITTVKIFSPPVITIISTGDELVRAGNPLAFGQVYYLLGPMLQALCRELSINDVHMSVVSDDTHAIVAALDSACARKSDVILLTGGMSQGEYDFVRPALEIFGVEQIFFRGAFRPGRPLYFGTRGTTRIFGLPGNPVAAYVCFHIFVRSLILASMQAHHRHKLHYAPAVNEFRKNPGTHFFARAHVDERGELRFLPNQGSHHLGSLAMANALAVIDAATHIVKAKDLVQYYPLKG